MISFTQKCWSKLDDCVKRRIEPFDLTFVSSQKVNERGTLFCPCLNRDLDVKLTSRRVPNVHKEFFRNQCRNR